MCDKPCALCKAMIERGETPSCPKAAVLPTTLAIDELTEVLDPEAQAELDARAAYREEVTRHPACGEY